MPGEIISSEEVPNGNGEDKKIQEGDKKQQKSKLLKFFVVVPLGIVLLLVVCYFGLDIVGRLTTPDFDDSDLLVKGVNIPRKDNGFFLLQEAIHASNVYGDKGAISDDFSLFQIIGGLFDGIIWNQKAVAKLLEEEKETLELFNQVPEKEKIQIPAFADIGNFKDMPSYNLGPWRELSLFAALRTISLAKEGRVEEAVKQVVVIMKVGDKIVHSPITTMGQSLSGVTIKDLGATLLRYLSRNFSLSEQAYNLSLERIETSADSKQGFANAVRFQYTSTKELIENLENDYSELYHYNPLLSIFIKNHYFYNPAKVRKLIAENIYRPPVRFLEEENCSNLGLLEQQGEAINQQAEQYRDRAFRKVGDSRFFSKDSLSRDIFLITTFSFDGMVRRMCEVKMRLELSQLFLALDRYKEKKGNFPAKLSDLSPEFISKVPEDVFTDSGIIYNRQRGIIYSVGKNQQDDGGDKEEDIVFNLTRSSQDWFEGGYFSELGPRDRERIIDIQNLGLVALLYYLDNGRYPVAESMVKSANNNFPLKGEDYISNGEILHDPYIDKGWFYGYQSDGKDFTLTARLENEDSELCDSVEKSMNGICIYKLTSE